MTIKRNVFHLSDPPATRIVFSVLGKFFISAVLATLYSFTVELFPTPIRNSMIGFCSTSGRIGCILSAYLADAVSSIDVAVLFMH